MNCYNCGKVLAEHDVTREHIPAKNLFEGYDDSYKANRITVPACYECNQKYSLTDEEFRNVVGVISNVSDNNAVSTKSVRSILRKSKGSRLHFDTFGFVRAVSFNKKHITDFHIKNFKGVFYNEYNLPVPSNMTIVVDINETYDEKRMGCIGYLRDNFLWKYSGHPDIFKYILQPFREVISKDKKDLIPTASDHYFMALQVYNQSHAALVIATDLEIKS